MVWFRAGVEASAVETMPTGARREKSGKAAAAKTSRMASIGQGESESICNFNDVMLQRALISERRAVIGGGESSFELRCR